MNPPMPALKPDMDEVEDKRNINYKMPGCTVPLAFKERPIVAYSRKGESMSCRDEVKEAGRQQTKHRDRSGYVQPNRLDKTQVGVHLPTNLASALDETIQRLGITKQKLFEDLVTDFVRQNASSTIREKLLQEEMKKRRIELGLI